MNWIDTQLLVYAAIADHPARQVVDRELRTGAWASSVLVLLECHHVLRRDYGVSADQAGATVARLARSPIHWSSLDVSAVAAAARPELRGLHSTDAVLLSLALEDAGSIVSQDQQLLRKAQQLGLATRNPISPILSSQVAEWEEQNLPAKGIARILSVVEGWVRRRDERLAAEFREATGGLAALPI